jgi:hypothetical protein
MKMENDNLEAAEREERRGEIRWKQVTRDREGQAISALVTHGLGAVEDVRDLAAAACATLRPEAKPLRSSDLPWPS